MMDTHERLMGLGMGLIALAAALARVMVAAGARSFLHGLWVVAAVLTVGVMVVMKK